MFFLKERTHKVKTQMEERQHAMMNIQGNVVIILHGYSIMKHLLFQYQDKETYHAVTELIVRGHSFQIKCRMLLLLIMMMMIEKRREEKNSRRKKQKTKWRIL